MVPLISSSDIAIVGRSCRLPGAPNVAGLWDLLASGTCAVGKIPADRWAQERLIHPRGSERGRSYTWAAGVLDDIWGFDAAAFGLSPREVEQMDPQQRLLLELTWEACEDAGIKPSALAGSQAGVFVGASALDYGNLRILDAAAGDAYFATGNALSIVSNRISYVFDLHGPSFTVDTACSSALVALNEAVVALRSGRIDTAIVGGVNILTSPFGFIGFSQASMLSRTGLCQAFSANADGYVRAEGGVVLILRTAAAAAADRIHANVVETGINSDGRTTGISLPSQVHQADLLRRLYARDDLAPERLAFVEAHGTGTRVGDPVECTALGQMLGARRSTPLPVGSIKTNIGHTEAASGLAGVLKATLALEHDALPPSLHAADLNPDIDFAGLNLTVNRALRPLPRGRETRLAGVNSFGFGGTNAHVVLADPPRTVAVPAGALAPRVLLLSAHSRAALGDLAADYAARLHEATPSEAAALVAGAGHRRERLAQRLVAVADDRETLAARLSNLPDEGEETPGLVRATAVERDAPVAFVYSGNGSQWAGMGVAAYARSATFRKTFDAVSARFEAHAGWSLKDALHSPRLANDLDQTQVAQPLLFAVQSATTAALAAAGLRPHFTLGHSVGEIAAAEAAGIFDLDTAVRVIHLRSLHQELTRDCGTMAVLIGARDTSEALLARLPRLEIAAINSPRAFTVSGPAEDIERLSGLARAQKARVRKLDLAYPFHSRLMAPVEAPLLRDLAGLAPRAGTVPFVSTVTGTVTPGTALDARYWWHNVRDPVRFSEAVVAAGRAGARIFIEIGPTATLLSHINDSLESTKINVAAFCALERKDRGEDPIVRAFAGALARGARIDAGKSFGGDPGAAFALPTYPWQHKTYRLHESSESAGQIRPGAWHPLAGARFVPERLEWHADVDTMLLPYLADHKIGGEVILPGAAFLEMALAVTRDWLGTATAHIADLDIVSPMHLAAESAREVICRITPAINALEIASRPRLGPAAWLTHVTAKIIREAPVDAGSTVPPAAFAEARTGEEIYAIAARAGLHFGPQFQQLARAAREGSEIAVELRPPAPDAGAPYGLHPARLDACFHGLILVFTDLAAADTRVAYVPVRFGAAKLLKPGVPIGGARIHLRRCDARAIIADFTLVAADGAVVATLSDARYQAFPTARDAALASHSIIRRTIPAAEPTAARHDKALPTAAFRDAAEASREAAETGELPADFLLLEGWATAVALHVARSLATAGRLNVEALIAGGRLPVAAEPWLLDCLDALEDSGLAEPVGAVWHIDTDTALPPTDAVLRSFAADHGRGAAELLLAAGTGDAVAALLVGDTARFERPWAASTLDAFELGGPAAVAAADVLTDLTAKALRDAPTDRALRVLQIGYGPLSGRIAALLAAVGGHLTIFDPERRRLERARLSLGGRGAVMFCDKASELPANGFDLLLAAEAHGLVSDPMAWPTLRGAMAPGAVFAGIEPGPSLFRALVLGLNGARTGQMPGAVRAAVGLDAAGWGEALKAAGLLDVAVDPVATGAGNAFLLTGAAAPERRRWQGTGNLLILGAGDARGTETTSTFATLLASAGLHVSICLDSDLRAEDLNDAPDIVVFLSDGGEQTGASTELLTDRCLRLKRCVDEIGHRKATLWVVTAGATGTEARADGNVAAGFWAFTRVLANEVATLDVRRVDIAADLSPEAVAARLRELVLSGTDETEIILEATGTRVVRFDVPSREATGGPAEAAHLERGTEGAGMDRLHWVPKPRVAPGPGEVELAVEATGLNFRDVMWGLGLLPDDILENGFAGPTLGLECAGRVLRVGAGVKGLAAGDHVVAFARSAFATHVTVPASIVSSVPAHIPSDTAATIPVAFLTAYYGLVFCARMRRGDWVLIHGGAGGVGLAALQIVRWRGARAICTAGSAEKRAMLRALGAEHVFDSRSGAFADAVRTVTGDGVDIVLNSLSGEAMERSLGTLRPFGRFVELGKRDYVANTHVGLRPFRRNLSYFGVDLDQLLLSDPSAARRLFASVMGLFHKGTLVPLPHRSFEAHEAVDAFRLMQGSGHIGKLVVKPPRPGEIRLAVETPFVVAADKTHLISGGLGGFGLEAARWLVARGARHLVLLGRSGAAGAAAKDAVADLQAAGAKVRVEALDIADKAAAQRLFASLSKTMPPIGGIMHAAMVLDDGAIANLDAATFERVARPKVAGAEHLDALSRMLPLDYFVLFSSATTLIGNPGQGAYVAANAFLEGLARRRRQAGLPALAVAWGAIEDVGVLAQSKAMRDALAARAGVKGMKAREGLDLMAGALSVQRPGAEGAVVAIAPMNWSAARTHLPLLNTPSYRNLASGAQTDSNERAKLDIVGLLGTESPEGVRKMVADLIVEEIARVLRLPRDDVSRTSALAEIGLDSLMAVELGLGLEERFGLKGALSTSASGFSVMELADHIIGLASGALSGGDIAAKGLAERHLGATIDADQLEGATALVRERSQALKDILQ